MAASIADNDIWHVLLTADDMKRMDLDQLDAAFHLSLVDASTLVWKAGMERWRRLGSIAGLDEPKEPPRPAPPPRRAPLAHRPPRPPSRSASPFQAAVMPLAQMEPTAPAYVYAPPLEPHAYAPPPQAAYAPPLEAPDPYVLPKRRIEIPSEVDFRRAPGSVRWGRWLLGLLLVTAGVLGAYRQNLLRAGARRVGIENQYLAGEHRVTAFVDAKAPASLKGALTRLSLLPGPNALPPAPVKPARALAPAAPPPAPTTTSAPASEPAVKTVSLDSLPVLTDGQAPVATTSTAATAAAAVSPSLKPVSATAEVRQARSVPARTTPAPIAKSEAKPKAEAKPKVEAKPKAEPRPPANETPLNAAIRMFMTKEAKKK